MIPRLLITPLETRSVDGPVPIEASASVTLAGAAWWLAAGTTNYFPDPHPDTLDEWGRIGTGVHTEIVPHGYAPGINSVRYIADGVGSSYQGAQLAIYPGAGTFVEGEAWTGQAMVKAPAGLTIRALVREQAGGVLTARHFDATGDWQRVFATHTMTSGVNWIHFRIDMNAWTAYEMEVAQPQIEPGPHPTPFTVGSRVPGTLAVPLGVEPEALLVRTRENDAVTTHHVTLTTGRVEVGGTTVTHDGTTLTVGTTDEVEVVGVLVFDAPPDASTIVRYTGMPTWLGWRVFGELPASNVVRPSSPPYIAQTRIWRCDREGRKIEELPLDMPVQGTITCNEDTRPARKLSLEVNDPDRLEPFRDWIMPEITLTDAAGISRTQDFGLYMVTPPRTKLSSSRYSGTIEGMGVTWRLLRATVANGRTIAAGTDHGAAARSIVLESGISPAQVSIPDTGTTLASPMRVDHGDRVMDVATALLNAANWYAPYMINAGQIVTAPTQELATARATIRYSADRDDVQIIPDLDEDPNWDRLRNRVTVRNIAPSRDPIYWTETITNPSHPLYHDPDDPDTFPVWLSETVDDPQVADESAAGVRARRLLSEGASYYRPVTVRTVLDMDADMHDVIELDLDRHGKRYDGLWFRRAWEVQLRGITAVTESQLWRIEQWR